MIQIYVINGMLSGIHVIQQTWLTFLWHTVDVTDGYFSCPQIFSYSAGLAFNWRCCCCMFECRERHACPPRGLVHCESTRKEAGLLSVCRYTNTSTTLGAVWRRESDRKRLRDRQRETKEGSKRKPDYRSSCATLQQSGEKVRLTRLMQCVCGRQTERKSPVWITKSEREREREPLPGISSIRDY